MSLSDLNHFGTMLSGCESINNGDFQSADGRYAFAVLKLHANDDGLRAGQEGFLDHIKKGAKNLKDWFLKLIKAITYYIDEITGQNAKARAIEKDIEDRAKELAKDLAALRAFKEKLIKAAETCFANPVAETKSIYDEINEKGYLDNKLFSSLNITNFRIDAGASAIENLSKLSDFGFDTHTEVAREIERLEKAISELTREAKREVSKYQDESVTKDQEKMIRISGLLLTKFTRVLKLWDDALKRLNKMME